MPLTLQADATAALRAGLKDQAGETLLIGVSGGGDSLALLLLATRWARDNGAQLCPVIIDHALRPESADEACQAAERARALGWAPVVVRWDGAKPDTGLQAAARDFRLHTFARLARQEGARAILLGHTLDDQAETVWRRLLSGGGVSALTAMTAHDPLPVWPEGWGIQLARPLLGLRRQALREYLREAGETWIDDPSNTDPAYSRVRDRTVLSRLEAAGFRVERLAAMADRLRQYERGQAEAAGRWLMQHAIFHPWGGASLTPGLVAPLRAMDALRAAVSGDPAPDRAAASKLANALATRKAFTAGGVALGYRGGEAWLIRDPGHVSGRADKGRSAPQIVQLGEKAVWDGRFEIRNPECDIHPMSALAGESPDHADLGPVPPAARPGLAHVSKKGDYQGLAGLDAENSLISWLAGALISRNLFGDRPPTWFHTQLRDQTAQGSH